MHNDRMVEMVSRGQVEKIAQGFNKLLEDPRVSNMTWHKELHDLARQLCKLAGIAAVEFRLP